MKILFATSCVLITATFLGWSIFVDAKKQPTFQHRDFLRVIALAPSYCETMIALKQSHRLVGVSNHCQQKNLAHIQKVGSFAEANFEIILQLKPDLVLAVPHAMAVNTINQLLDHNIEVYAAQPDSLSDITQITLDLARKFNVEEEGLLVNQKIESALKQAKTLAQQPHSRILIAIAGSPFVVAGKNTFASEVVQHFGLTNMAQSPSATWPVWPLEKFLSDPPDVVLIAQGAEFWPQYQTLFTSLGIDLNNSRIKFLIPARPIFESPSPALIEDIEYFSKLW